MQFTIYGDPVPQGRPRFYRRGKFVGTYDPAKSVAFKRRVVIAAKTAGVSVMEGPVSMSLQFIFKRPRRLLKRDVLNGTSPHSIRPDLDNCIKAVMDGLKSVAYKDDCQVVWLDCSKYYCELGGMPRVEVRII